jgi:hypothetical protein
MALGLDIVGRDLSPLIQRHAGNLFRTPFPRTNAREKQQIAYALRMRVWADRFRRPLGIDPFHDEKLRLRKSKKGYWLPQRKLRLKEGKS